MEGHTMKIRYTENWMPAASRRRLAAFILVAAAVSMWTFRTTAQAQITPKHATPPTHQTLMEYAVSKAGELPTPLAFSGTASTRMREGAGDEDLFGRPTCLSTPARAIQHGWKVVTDAPFVNPCSGVIQTMTAHEALACSPGAAWDRPS